MAIHKRKFPDLIEAIEGSLKDSEIPKKFTRWASISAVAGALQKRVWYDYGAFKLYPNMFIFLVANPTVGKSVSLIVPFNHIYKKLSEDPGLIKSNWNRSFKKFGLEMPLFLLRDKITPQQIQVEMSKGCKQYLIKRNTLNGEDVIQSAATLTTSEMATFIKRNDENIHAFMTEMWDSKEDHGDKTKTQGKYPIIEPCLNWICCATPDQFVKNLPSDVQGQGFLSRLFIVYYNGPGMHEDIFYDAPPEERIIDFVDDMAQVAQLNGQFTFENPNKVREWVRAGMPPKPTSPVMKFYNGRRVAQFMKLCMIISASRRSDLVIRDEDWATAKDLILGEEPNMPKALENFGVSDGAHVIRDVLYHAFSGEKKVISLRKFKRILLDRVKSPSEVSSYMTQMEEAGHISVEDKIVRGK